MSHSPRLFLKPLAETPPASTLSVTGAFPLYRTDLNYAGRIQINNSVGKCKVDVLSHATLPDGWLAYVDNVTKEVVITFPKRTVQGPVMAPVLNGSWEDDMTDWEPQGPGWDVFTGDAYQGSKKARCINVKGETRLRGAPVPAQEGSLVNLGVYVQQGASSAGNAGGAAEIVWLDADLNVLDTQQGNRIMQGSNGEWQESRLQRVGPANTAYVCPQMFCIRKRQNRGLYFDYATWSHQYTVGPGNPVPINLTLRVTDADNSTADWTGTIMPKVVRHFRYWEQAFSFAGNCPTAFDEGHNLWCQARQDSRSLWIASDIAGPWTEKTNFFPTVLANSTTDPSMGEMVYNPGTGKMCCTGFASTTTPSSTSARGYIFDPTASAAISNTTSINNSQGLIPVNNCFFTGTSTIYTTISGASWASDVFGATREPCQNNQYAYRPAWKSVRSFTIQSTAGLPQQSVLLGNLADTNVFTKTLSPAQGFPSGGPGDGTQTTVRVHYAEELGFALAGVVTRVNTSSDPVAGQLYKFTGQTDAPVIWSRLPAFGPTQSTNVRSAICYCDWAEEWIAVYDLGIVARPNTAVSQNKDATAWNLVAHTGADLGTTAQTLDKTRAVIVAKAQEQLVIKAGGFFYRAVFTADPM